MKFLLTITFIDGTQATAEVWSESQAKVIAAALNASPVMDRVEWREA